MNLVEVYINIFNVIIILRIVNLLDLHINIFNVIITLHVVNLLELHINIFNINHNFRYCAFVGGTYK